MESAAESLRRPGLAAWLLAACWFGAAAAQPADPLGRLVDPLIAAHPGQSGAYVLEKGSEALMARAWLADHARDSIEVQYFIWSTDNIGILAAEALLRAAERGVRVRVLVDDLLIDAPDDSLLALARHPRIDIRIYNPQTSVGIPLLRRLLNVLTDFHGVNQRMHDKTFVVDGKVAITGGRNMAVEYFDYSHSYNFRDRDVLLVGAAAADVRASFNAFWNSAQVAAVESLYDGWGLMQKNVMVDEAQARDIYRALHEYAQQPENFAPEVRAAIASVPQLAPALIGTLRWGTVDFISDRPGKNAGGFSGGGRSSAALAALAASARERIVIQSPYLVLSDRALELFAQARARGVRVRINTNSLASTDNLQAFSGYRKQRAQLLALGLEIFEFRPDAAVQRELLQRAAPPPGVQPAFSLHAKTLVVDGSVVYIGTFNLDPRSENLNTEVGAILRDAGLAARVEAAIETDMASGNSWSAGADDPDRHAPFSKWLRVWFYQLLPLRPLL
jgi:cardiolipin synthase C